MAGVLAGKVAVVTGASRGVGRGVALGLGEAGATVYITARTAEAGTHLIPGTIAETAEEVARLGGMGIAVRVDLRNDAEVDALFERVSQEQGRLDILVNSAWPTPTGKMPVGVPFWELPVSSWDDMASVGLRSYIVASRHAARIMIDQGSGLIVQISSPAAVRPTSIMFDGVCKAAQQRLTEEMARALKPYGVAVVALWPGYVRSEKNLAEPDRWPPEMMERFERIGESAQFTGRAVAALAADPRVMEKTGQALAVGELAVEYGFTDVDGKSPSPWREMIAGRRA
jgi:dehydrogenase/reductase SDR family member 1